MNDGWFGPIQQGQDRQTRERQRKWDLRFLELAKFVSTWSKDPSTQTGAVLTHGRHVISLGFNGFPYSMPDDPLLYSIREEKYQRIVHCEVNALISARRDVLGATLYTYPFMSCDRCAVQMLQAGVFRFVAPQATPEQLERWGESFKRTKRYITECGGTWLEI